MNIEELTQCFMTLGLQPGASAEQVKEAYRHSIQAFHPDKFPADSPSQKWASERLLVVKDAYEKLQDFFKENPSGAPPGGWTGQAKTSSQGTTTSADESGSMDWEKFDQQLHSNFSEEVKAWEARQREKESANISQSKKSQRYKTLTIGRFVVVGVLFLLLAGMYSHNGGISMERERERHNFEMKWVLTLGSPMSQEAADELHKMEALNNEEDVLRYIQYFFLWGLVGVGGWLLFAKRPKAVMETWAETGIADLQELKMAAKDTAQLTASTAKYAAKIAAAKAVETAEKLKAESEKFKEKRAQEKMHEAGNTPASKPAGKPSNTDDIIAAAEEERKKMEAEFDQKRSRTRKPKAKPDTASTAPDETPEKPVKGTKEMLADLINAEENSEKPSGKTGAKRKKKETTDK